MKTQAFIFIGRSGSGKGTQASLLMAKLRATDSKKDVLYLQTGDELRHFIQGDTFTQRAANTAYNTGALMPEFLSVYAWIKALVDRYQGTEHLVFDGTPRKIHEAGVLNSVFDFFGVERPWVILVNISEREALRRLLIRKRMDDDEDEIKKRLAWYETEVVKTVEYYRHNPMYRFLEINGERPIEEIQADIVQKVGLA